MVQHFTNSCAIFIYCYLYIISWRTAVSVFVLPVLVIDTSDLNCDIYLYSDFYLVISQMGNINLTLCNSKYKI